MEALDSESDDHGKPALEMSLEGEQSAPVEQLVEEMGLAGKQKE